MYVILLHICNEAATVSTAAKMPVPTASPETGWAWRQGSTAAKMHLPKLSRSEQFPHREQAISMSKGSAGWGR